MHFILKKINSYIKEKGEVNYLYFSAFLTGLTIFTFSHLLLLEYPIFGIQLFFLIYAFGQAFLETWVFVLVTYLLKKWAPRWVLFLFICTSFLLLLLHFTNFTMLRLMDVTISYAFKFFFGAGIKQFIIGFQALNMNMGMVLLIFLSLPLIPLGGLLLYLGTNHVSKKKPWNISIQQIFFAVSITGSILLGLDFAAQPYINRVIYRKYQKALPFGTTFLGDAPLFADLSRPLSPPFIKKEINFPLLNAPAKPNIYLFVIETLRKDSVNQKTAPYLTSFGKENIEISSSFSNANGTHPSWFAIFHSTFPFHWTAVRDTWDKGAPPLQMLKELGYKIRVYSSSDLHHFGMDRILFGNNRNLADQMNEFSSISCLEPCERDALCIDTFQTDVQKDDGKEGNVYLFFLDSTHSEYSLPKNFPLKFTPSAKQIDYLTLNPRQIEPIKNRYYNTISYIDSLMNRFFTTLKQEGLYEKAVVAITGDHGEEFFEEGALFHGTHLNRYQTEVPIFFKCPGATHWSTEATHIDIFPSLLHHITGHADFSKLLDGNSIFRENGSPYRVTVMQNGPDTPNEISIHKGLNRVHLRFSPSKNIYDQTQVEIIELQMPEESPDLTQIELAKKYFSDLSPLPSQD